MANVKNESCDATSKGRQTVGRSALLPIQIKPNATKKQASVP